MTLRKLCYHILLYGLRALCAVRYKMFGPSLVVEEVRPVIEPLFYIFSFNGITVEMRWSQQLSMFGIKPFYDNLLLPLFPLRPRSHWFNC